jgi:hypothetical protein
MHEFLIKLFFKENEDPQSLKVDLLRYCDGHGLSIIQFVSMRRNDPGCVTMRLSGSKRNLMNFIAGKFYNNQILPLTRSDGELRDGKIASPL